MESSKMTAVGDMRWACPHSGGHGANLSYNSGSWMLDIWHPEQMPGDRKSAEEGIREFGILPFTALQLPLCFFVVNFRALSIEGSFSSAIGRITADDAAAMRHALKEAKKEGKVPSIPYCIMNTAGIVRRQGIVSLSHGWWVEFLAQLSTQVEGGMSAPEHKAHVATIESGFSPDQIWARCRTERLRKVDIG